MKRALTLAVVLAIAPAGSAKAAELRIVTAAPHQELYYTAGPGEANDVTFHDDGNTITITDRGVLAVLPARESTDELGNELSSCTFVLNTVTCPAYQFVHVALGDGNDKFANTSPSVPYSAVPTVDAGPGDDAGSGPLWFVGGPGADDLSGGTFVYGADEPGGVTVTMDGVADDGHPGERDNVRPGVQLRVYSQGDNTLSGSPGDDSIEVSQDVTGHSVITGGAGGDWLIGGGGDDTIDARDGVFDTVACGGGNDELLADQADIGGSQGLSDCETISTG